MEESKPERDVKLPYPIESAKEEIEAIMHTERIHSKETHGTSGDIDENTPVDRVRAPGVLERVKEEIEALVQTVHAKKESEQKPDEEGGFWRFLGENLEKCCIPFAGKRD